MRGAIIVFLGVLSVSCAAAPRREPESGLRPAPAPAASWARPTAAARVTRCVASPSTIYGDEVVAFELEGEGEGESDVELFDQRQQSLFRGRAPVRGRLPLSDLPSGDFTLRVARSRASCQVTVNRELPRASSAGR